MSGLPNRILSATSSFAHDPVGCTSLVSSSLSLIRSNSACNAFLSVFQESAEEEARQADFRYSRNIALSPIDGIPVAVKDNFVVESPVHSTTAGSKMLQNFKSPVTATVVERLRKAGAILVGKTNMDEFGMGSGSVNGAFGPVRNPRNLMLSAGGSSGGSAAAVAFGGCLA